jgi:GGDEF domain-containing protein
MYNFDFKKYLTENKLTSNSKLLSEIVSGRILGKEFIVVKITSRGLIDSIEKKSINTQLPEFFKSEVEDMIANAEDEDAVDYIEEFAGWEVAPDGKSGILYLNEEEYEMYINKQKYPQEYHELEDLSPHSNERIDNILSFIFTGEWYQTSIPGYN